MATSIWESRFMEDFDLELIKFYYQIIKDDIKGNSTDVNRNSLKKIIRFFRKETIGVKSSDLIFDSSTAKCAYIYNYGPCVSSTVAYHFLKMLDNNYFLFQKTSLLEKFTICSLGGGPVIELISILKILERKVANLYSERNDPLKVDAFIVGKDKVWTSTMTKITQSVSQSVSSSLLQLNFVFLEVDLTQPLTEDLKDILMKSDLVTVISFFPAVPGYTNIDVNLEMIQEIISIIDKDAILFFLDFREPEYSGFLVDGIDSSSSMVQIYGPHRNHIHRMSLLCMRECLRLYSKYYGWRYCDIETTSCGCAWYKI